MINAFIFDYFFFTLQDDWSIVINFFKGKLACLIFQTCPCRLKIFEDTIFYRNRCILPVIRTGLILLKYRLWLQASSGEKVIFPTRSTITSSETRSSSTHWNPLQLKHDFFTCRTWWTLSNAFVTSTKRAITIKLNTLEPTRAETDSFNSLT